MKQPESQPPTNGASPVGSGAVLAAGWRLNLPKYTCDETACGASIEYLDEKGMLKHLICLEAYPNEKTLQSAADLVKAANRPDERHSEKTNDMNEASDKLNPATVSTPSGGSAAKPSLVNDADREARIYADVYNPNETDLEYFLRRKAYHEQSQPND